MSDDLRQLDRLGTDVIPVGWTLSTVGDACAIRNELRLPLAVEVRATMKGDYRYYGPTGILDYINECRVEGDFALIGEDGDHFLDVDRKPQTLRVSGKFNVNNHAHIVGAGPGCSVDWFQYFFVARDISHSLTRQGAGRYKLTKAALTKLPILLPPLPEQRKIAEILQTWDEAIEKLGALVDIKLAHREQLRSSLIAAAGRNARPAFFSEFLAESRETGTDGATAKKITVRLYGKGAVEKSEQVMGSANTRYFVRKTGQLIYSKLDFLNGAFALIPEELDGFQSTLDLPCFDIESIANPRWVLEYLTRPAFYSQQVHLARGQRKARRVAPEDLLATPVRLPSRAAQDRVVEILSEADREITLNRQALIVLRQQKRGLMQKLLTGEWRVTSRG